MNEHDQPTVMSKEPRTEFVHLHYLEGASDKIYHVKLEPKPSVSESVTSKRRT